LVHDIDFQKANSVALHENYGQIMFN